MNTTSQNASQVKPRFEQKVVALPAFRKLALSLWSKTGDPSVYGLFDLDVTEMRNHSQILPVIIKSLAYVMQQNPELRSILKRGHIIRRPDSTISVMVNIPKGEHTDLSVLSIENPHDMSITKIEEMIAGKASKIRAAQDMHLGPVLSLIQSLPQPLVRAFTWIYEILHYEFNVPIRLKIFPKQPFGSIIVSNVGSLGIKNALLPLVPLARAVMLVSIGRISKEPKVHNNEIKIRDVVQVGVTFDHRVFDGSHAAKMLTDFESAFEKLKRES